MSQFITTPQLPPKAGYIEVIDGNGEHVYQKIETEQDRQIDTVEWNSTQQIQALSDLLDFYEECIIEMAMIVYAEPSE
jgi:hypothetical protein